MGLCSAESTYSRFRCPSACRGRGHPVARPPPAPWTARTSRILPFAAATEAFTEASARCRCLIAGECVPMYTDVVQERRILISRGGILMAEILMTAVCKLCCDAWMRQRYNLCEFMLKVRVRWKNVYTDLINFGKLDIWIMKNEFIKTFSNLVKRLHKSV